MRRFLALVQMVLVVGFALFAPALAAPPSEDELKALDSQMTAAFNARHYDQALKIAEHKAAIIEQSEADKGKARDLTALALGNIAWCALFANQPQRALDAIARALEIAPDTLWLEINRAHALLFLGRTPAAINIYVSHKGETVPGSDKWEEVILKDFSDFRERGLNSLLLAQAEKALAAAPNSPEVLNETMLKLIRSRDYQKAIPLAELYVQAMKSRYGEEHPKYATALNNLAQPLYATNRLAEAEPLFRRALAIDEKSFGPDHPDVAIVLNNLARLLRTTNRLAEAEPLMRRALAIDEKSLGPDHPSRGPHPQQSGAAAAGHEPAG